MTTILVLFSFFDGASPSDAPVVVKALRQVKTPVVKMGRLLNP